ncbi:MAG: radical SAM protein [Ignavibacteriales bacterium]|nr:radical SAM protein [Ignavibacteriales bacterium]
MRLLPPKKYAQTLQHLWYNYIHQGNGVTYPFYASYKINQTCNFKCRFCNLWQEQSPGLPTDKVFKVLDNLGNSSIFLLSFEGGEPLLRPDFMEVLKYTRTKPFYLMITTSERGLTTDYPMREYCKYIDFLHISIDEGHVNMEMFDQLEEFVAFGSSVCVQTVVTQKDIGRLEYKVQRCRQAGAKIVIMPAVHLEGTRDYYPEFYEFRDTVLDLKKRYPNIITTPDNFFKNIDQGSCSSSSIVIDADGTLYYPCRVLPYRAINMAESSLMEFVKTRQAAEMRNVMTACDKHCGWYQYFATSSFTSLSEASGALRPYFADFLRLGITTPQHSSPLPPAKVAQ